MLVIVLSMELFTAKTQKPKKKKAAPPPEDVPNMEPENLQYTS